VWIGHLDVPRGIVGRRAGLCHLEGTEPLIAGHHATTDAADLMARQLAAGTTRRRQPKYRAGLRVGLGFIIGITIINEMLEAVNSSGLWPFLPCSPLSHHVGQPIIV
jgi:hypothetical protein